MTKLSYGESINTFIWGFEICDFKEFKEVFELITGYISYRPKNKILLTVGQLDWHKIKHLKPIEQFNEVILELSNSIRRIKNAKRKPKYFNLNLFETDFDEILKSLKPPDYLIELDELKI